MKNCLEYALNYISRFPKTEKELKVQLLHKGYFSDEVTKTIENLKSKNYVNDEMFAQSYIRSECSNKGKPLIRVIKKLQEKGIDRDLLDKSVKSAEEDINKGIHDKILREIEVYKRKGEIGFDIIQKLIRKGYKYQDIKDAIDAKSD